MLAWIAARCLDTSRQRPSAIVAMIFSNLIAQSGSGCLAHRNQPRVRQAARQTEKAAKCPEPLCPTRVLPPLGRRDPSPERTLLLRLRSYRLIRRSRWALSSFGFWPRLQSPCRLLPVPAAHGSFPTLSPTVCS